MDFGSDGSVLTDERHRDELAAVLLKQPFEGGGGEGCPAPLLGREGGFKVDVRHFFSCNPQC